MNAEELAAIEKRAEASTSGPWSLINDAELLLVTSEKHGPVTADMRDREPGEVVYVERTEDEGGRADGEFIAAARTDVPRLVAEVRNLTGERNVARAERDEAQAAIAHVRRIATAMQDRASKVIHGDQYEQGQLLVLEGAARELLAALDGVTPLQCGCGIPPDGAPGASGCSVGCMDPVPTDAELANAEKAAAIERARVTLDQLLRHPGAVPADAVHQLQTDLGLRKDGA